jgi:hypothetical protein
MHSSTWNHEIVKGWTTFVKAIFVGNQTHEHGGRLKVQIHILFHGDNS